MEYDGYRKQAAMPQNKEVIMLNELIYTRCGTGRDILENGVYQPGEGFKAHSCSQELFQEGVDFPFIKGEKNRLWQL